MATCFNDRFFTNLIHICNVPIRSVLDEIYLFLSNWFSLYSVEHGNNGYGFYFYAAISFFGRHPSYGVCRPLFHLEFSFSLYHIGVLDGLPFRDYLRYDTKKPTPRSLAIRHYRPRSGKVLRFAFPSQLYELICTSPPYARASLLISEIGDLEGNAMMMTCAFSLFWFLASYFSFIFLCLTYILTDKAAIY